jgi:beta-lactam-binding protein with PASTA domain
MSPIEPGSIIGDRYELLRQLGAGGMARVYLAHDLLLGRRVAIKVLSERYAADPAFVERFRREASAAAALNHPNIVGVYDRGEVDDNYFIVMEYLDGPDLKQIIRERAPLPPVEAIDFALQILSALGAAHRRDIVHRDIKPQNAMVAEDGRLKVTDFGIARAGADTEMTEVGSIIGTAQYLSPEQARGDDVTAASDCYAVGLVLYEMLVGRVPFDGDRPVVVAMKQVNDAPVPPQALVPSIPDDLNAIVLMSLQKRPSDRFRTAEEFAAALRESRDRLTGHAPTAVMGAGATQVMDPQPTAPTRVTPPRARPPAAPPQAPKGRGGRAVWIVALLLLGALAVAGGLLFLGDGGGGGGGSTVPSVVGQTQAEAERAVIAENLVPRTRSVPSEVEVGRVVATDPVAGADVDAGSTVRLDVSSGPDTAQVPNVVGKTQEDAEIQITQADFEVGEVTERDDPDVDPGTVIAQSPKGGSDAAPGSAIDLIVSSGGDTVRVPDVSGLSQGDAESALAEDDLEVSGVGSEESDQFEPGTVVRTEPAAGQDVERGSSVRVIVAAAPATVTVPNLVGRSESRAFEILQGRGFRVSSSEAEPQGGEPAGQVIDQFPAAGTEADRGETVEIVISTGPPDSGVQGLPDPGGGGGGAEPQPDG